MDRREVLGVFGVTAVGVADVTGVAASAEDRKGTGEADKTAKAFRVRKENENLTGRAYEYFHKLQQW